MNKKLLTSSLLLVIAGLVVLGGIWAYRYTSLRLADEYKTFCTDRTGEYLKVYDNWRALTSDEREGYLLDSSNFAPSQSSQQTRSEQTARLKANLPEIARNGPKEPITVAEMLYGPDWLIEVQKYNKLQEIIDVIIAAATISIMLGIIVMFGCLLKLCAVSIAAKYKSTLSADADYDNANQPEPPKPDISLVRPAKSVGNPLEEVENVDNEPESLLAESPDGELDYFHKISLLPPKPEQLSKLYTTEPLTPDNGLVELTQEVTAIRQFASQQQDRVQQLQDGYDWTIIKRFCMRIIRCIDNLDARIEKLLNDGVETSYLQDVRDELVFAIESSGVEQIPILAGSIYKGNEKIAEAVVEKELTYDKDLTGKVARIVRPGYQYVINDQQMRVVRTAQVVLYG